MTAWVIDNRTTYDGQHGLGCKPLQLGAVVAECPTAFGGITIRDPSTIDKPCPTVAELDALGLKHAHLCKAAPQMLAALRELRDAEAAAEAHERSCMYCAADAGGCPEEAVFARMELAIEARDSAIASAEGRELPA